VGQPKSTKERAKNDWTFSASPKLPENNNTAGENKDLSV
jgi:hypothetical protein